jgi:glutamate carboxypeptidase
VAIELAYQLLRLNKLGDAEKGITVNLTIVRERMTVNIIPAFATGEVHMRYTDAHEIVRILHDAQRTIQKHLILDTVAEVNI